MNQALPRKMVVAARRASSSNRHRRRRYPACLDTPAAGWQCCLEISHEVVERVASYRRHGIEVVAVLGGNPESPGCAAHSEPGDLSCAQPASGIFTQALASALETVSIGVPFHGFRDCRQDWLDADLRWLQARLRA